MSNQKFEIPWEAADLITLSSLESHYRMAKESLDDSYTGSRWLHKDDLEYYAILKHHLKAIIEYYGGSVD